ncbi:hypothetical protein EVAR_47842_1 [Eumeta japonica]|uniref:Uncharacterized protein n=1 Tax=Eumeta variegata TaxID=151549 RepID=A0A4C1XRL1_EUMVA|nr:hypothetical protein EVAR_47842_1 [Eumeta japonica]
MSTKVLPTESTPSKPQRGQEGSTLNLHGNYLKAIAMGRDTNRGKGSMISDEHSGTAVSIRSVVCPSKKGHLAHRLRRVTLNDEMKALRPLSARRELQRNVLTTVEFRKEKTMQFLPIFFMLPLTVFDIGRLQIFLKDTMEHRVKRKLRSSGNE